MKYTQKQLDQAIEMAREAGIISAKTDANLEIDRLRSEISSLKAKDCIEVTKLITMLEQEKKERDTYKHSMIELYEQVQSKNKEIDKLKEHISILESEIKQLTDCIAKEDITTFVCSMKEKAQLEIDNENLRVRNKCLENLLDKATNICNFQNELEILIKKYYPNFGKE